MFMVLIFLKCNIQTPHEKIKTPHEKIQTPHEKIKTPHEEFIN